MDTYRDFFGDLKKLPNSGPMRERLNVKVAEGETMPGYVDALETIATGVNDGARQKDGTFVYSDPLQVLLLEMLTVLIPLDRAKRYRVIVEYDPEECMVTWIATDGSPT